MNRRFTHAAFSDYGDYRRLRRERLANRKYHSRVRREVHDSSSPVRLTFRKVSENEAISSTYIANAGMLTCDWLLVRQ